MEQQATTTPKLDYPYTVYLAERAAQPEPPALLSEAEFEANLLSYMWFTREIGAAYRRGENRVAEALREKRRPLKLALLIGG